MNHILGLLFMGILTFIPPEPTKNPKHHPQPPKLRRKNHHENHPKTTKPKPKQKPHPILQKQPSSWDQIKNLLTCKQVEGSRVHDPSKTGPGSSGQVNFGSSCGSMCRFSDVVHGNTSRVVHRSDNSSPESSSLGQDGRTLGRSRPAGSGSNRSSSLSVISGVSGSTAHSVYPRGLPLRKLSGCYECHMIVDPSRYPIVPRSTVCACPQCGQIFPKMESLEHHQSLRHAVSELGMEDSGRNIVEIIFKSSWMKKDNPMWKIQRILKVHNTQRTIQRFEDCRDVVKLRGNSNNKKNPRCAADGNELLRFHCTTLTCCLGANGSSSLCASFPTCGVCTIIRHGFQGSKGVRTTASSGRAHDSLKTKDTCRAMLVCRVIAGRVRRTSSYDAPAEQEIQQPHDSSSYDSITGCTGVYEDLLVFNPRAILPCFVVIYNTLTIT